MDWKSCSSLEDHSSLPLHIIYFCPGELFFFFFSFLWLVGLC